MQSAENPTRDIQASVRAFLAGLLVLFLAAVIARGMLGLVRTHSPRMTFIDETNYLEVVEDMLPWLPELAAKKEPIAYIHGPSVASWGFSPAIFDETLRELSSPITSYDLGAASNSVQNTSMLIDRQRELHHAAGTRAKLTVFVQSPFVFNKNFWPASRGNNILKIAASTTWQELGKLALSNPHLASELSTLRVMGGIGAADVTNILPSWIAVAGPPSWWKGQAAPRFKSEWLRLHSELHEARHRFQPNMWDYEKRGEVLFYLEGNAEQRALYEQWIKEFESGYGRTLLSRVQKSLDRMEDLPVHRPHLEGFIGSIEEAKRFSDHVLVVILPHRPDVPVSPAGIESLRALLSEVSERTGVRTLNLFQSEDFVYEDFQDLTHFKQDTGRPKFSRNLAEYVKPILEGAR